MTEELQIENGMVFIQSVTPSPSEQNEPAWWFVFSGARLMVKSKDRAVSVPQTSDLPCDFDNSLYIGALNGEPCFATELPENAVSSNGLKFVGLRNLFGRLGDEFHRIAGISLHLLNWEKKHRFCGGCGSPTENKGNERAKICPECGQMDFPTMSPAIIVSIVKENRILLARSNRFPNSKMYSVLAGYQEPGETLEQCVEREIMEETGIRVKNIRYFGSQHWPYSEASMIGFTAEYAGGEIAIDGDEIAEADWFAADNLPEIPGWGSIAGKLIARFKQKSMRKNS